MAKAYAQFSRMVQEQFGGGGDGGSGSGFSSAAGAGREGSGGTTAALPLSTPRTQLAALLASSSAGQHSTATLVVLLVACMLVYRMSLGDAVTAQLLLQRLTGQLLPGAPAVA
jgi:hypothetical protein